MIDSEKTTTYSLSKMVTPGLLLCQCGNFFVTQVTIRGDIDSSFVGREDIPIDLLLRLRVFFQDFAQCPLRSVDMVDIRRVLTGLGQRLEGLQPLSGVSVVLQDVVTNPPADRLGVLVRSDAYLILFS